MPGPIAEDLARIQRRTLALLVTTQIIGGVGLATGIALGALLAASMAGVGASGLAGSAAVIGAAFVAVPATRIMRGWGRRPGLVFGYLTGSVGAVVVVASVLAGSVTLLFAGMFLFGGASAANLQARYAAVDLAPPARRARHLSLVVWATTIGAVAGPNLAPLANDVATRWGVRDYAGPYLLSAAVLGVAALALLLLLRPDPLLTARTREALRNDEGLTPTRGGLWRDAVRAVQASPGARLGVAAVTAGHVVMVGIMSMTPVYISGYVHEHADQLRVVGLVISLHIAGMYALSPLAGWFADRLGPRPVILGGVGVLLVACAVAGTSADSTWRLSVGLGLVGLGWLGTMVAGSTLLSVSVPVAQRASVQGLSDVAMGTAGASAGAVAGVVVDYFGYPTLTLLAAVTTVPLVGLALRRLPPAAGDGRLVQCG